MHYLQIQLNKVRFDCQYNTFIALQIAHESGCGEKVRTEISKRDRQPDFARSSFHLPLPDDFASDRSCCLFLGAFVVTNSLEDGATEEKTDKKPEATLLGSTKVCLSSLDLKERPFPQELTFCRPNDPSTSVGSISFAASVSEKPDPDEEGKGEDSVVWRPASDADWNFGTAVSRPKTFDDAFSVECCFHCGQLAAPIGPATVRLRASAGRDSAKTGAVPSSSLSWSDILVVKVRNNPAPVLRLQLLDGSDDSVELASFDLPLKSLSPLSHHSCCIPMMKESEVACWITTTLCLSSNGSEVVDPAADVPTSWKVTTRTGQLLQMLNVRLCHHTQRRSLVNDKLSWPPGGPASDGQNRFSFGTLQLVKESVAKKFCDSLNEGEGVASVFPESGPDLQRGFPMHCGPSIDFGSAQQTSFRVLPGQPFPLDWMKGPIDVPESLDARWNTAPAFPSKSDFPSIPLSVAFPSSVVPFKQLPDAEQFVLLVTLRELDAVCGPVLAEAKDATSSSGVRPSKTSEAVELLGAAVVPLPEMTPLATAREVSAPHLQCGDVILASGRESDAVVEVTWRHCANVACLNRVVPLAPTPPVPVEEKSEAASPRESVVSSRSGDHSPTPRESPRDDFPQKAEVRSRRPSSASSMLNPEIMDSSPPRSPPPEKLFHRRMSRRSVDGGVDNTVVEVLKEELREKQAIIHSLRKDLNDRAVAIRNCGVEIVTLHRQLRRNGEDGSALRERIEQLESMRREEDMVFAGELEAIPVGEKLQQAFRTLVHRHKVLLAQNAKNEKKVSHLRDQLASLPEMKREFDDLRKAHTAQSAMLQQLQMASGKIGKYKATVKTQEKVIQKLEKLLRSSVKSKDFGVDDGARVPPQGSVVTRALRVDAGDDSELVDELRAVILARETRIDAIESQMLENSETFAVDLSKAKQRILELQQELEQHKSVPKLLMDEEPKPRGRRKPVHRREPSPRLPHLDNSDPEPPQPRRGRRTPRRRDDDVEESLQDDYDDYRPPSSGGRRARRPHSGSRRSNHSREHREYRVSDERRSFDSDSPTEPRDPRQKRNIWREDDPYEERRGRRRPRSREY